MFGLSFSEFLVIGIVALVAVGPEKLPGMLRTLGEWIRKARNLTYDIRAQSGIDEILRAEGLHGGVSELKSLIRAAQSPFLNLNIGANGAARPSPPVTPDPAVPEAGGPGSLDPNPLPPSRYEDPYAELDVDATREYPPEGPDAYGALPDDLVDDGLDRSEHVDVLNAAQPLRDDASAVAADTSSAAPETNAVAPDASATTETTAPVASESPASAPETRASS